MTYINKEGEEIDTGYGIFVATDDDEIVGRPMSPTYKHITNEQFLDLVSDAMKRLPKAKLESIGSVANRGKVFASVSLAGKSEYKIGDIIFRSDDGSGGKTAYFTIDGSFEKTVFAKDIFLNDSVKTIFGNSSDLQIYHDGSNSYIQNETGNLTIFNKADDKDIIFASDNGSGGTADYTRLDGSTGITQFDKDTKHNDNIKATFGGGSDLQIYHDGSNSYINETGTGSLIVQASDLFLRAGGTNNTNNALVAYNAGNVVLYHASSAKLETLSTGS